MLASQESSQGTEDSQWQDSQNISSYIFNTQPKLQPQVIIIELLSFWQNKTATGEDRKKKKKVLWYNSVYYWDG